MTPDPIDLLLADYSKQPVPPVPSHLDAEVRREIERRRQQSVWSRLFTAKSWREFSAEPSLALAGLSFAVLVGILPAAALARATSAEQLARQSIHFEIFSSASAGQVLTLTPAAAGAKEQP